MIGLYKGQAMAFSVGNKTIQHDSELTGFHVGNVKVANNVSVKVGGFYIGNIVADNDAKIVVTGRMVGNILTEDGLVVVTGTLWG
jgi:hypothetical protein